MNFSKTIDSLTKWIETNTPKEHGLLIPVSGGSDSALCFWLCQSAIGERTMAIYVGSDLRQKEWIESIGSIQYTDIPIDSDNPEVDRWACFLKVALKNQLILTGSRNLTEHTLGTYSTASKVASFLPLVGLWKHQVMDLCRHVGVPKEILASSLQADPACGRPEEMAAIPFDTVDAFLQVKLGIQKTSPDFAPGQREYLESVYASNLFKKDLPLVGPRAV